MKEFTFVCFQKESQVPVSPLALKTLRLETTAKSGFDGGIQRLAAMPLFKIVADPSPQ